MATRNQVMPLAPSAYGFRTEEDEAISRELKKLSRRTYLQCWGCFIALLLIVAVMIIVLATVFHVNNPSIKMNSVKIQHMGLFVNISSDLKPTLFEDISLKNPNMASFRYSNTTTTIYYGGMVVCESRIPPGLAKARRTLRLNMTMDIIPEKILSVPGLSSDLRSGALNMSSYTRIVGEVKLFKIFKKSIAVKMNCTFTVNIKSQAIQGTCNKGKLTGY